MKWLYEFFVETIKRDLRAANFRFISAFCGHHPITAWYFTSTKFAVIIDYQLNREYVLARIKYFDAQILLES